MSARLTGAAASALLLSAAVPDHASAHGLVAREDLPIPEWLFAWGAMVVLIVSFVALAVLWPKPRLQNPEWRELPTGFSRVVTSRALEVTCGAVGVFVLCVVVYSGFAGSATPAGNLAPTFVYIVFWLGLVPASVLFGDVFRAFNPWRAIGRAVGWLVHRLTRTNLPAPLPYPGWLGRWPAVAGILAFVWLEIVATDGDRPETIAVATLLYSAVTFVVMALYGVERWIERGEAFSVYFNLFSRVSVFERRGGRVGIRPPLGGLPALSVLPGTVPFVTTVIGTVSFDGFSAGRTWSDIAAELQDPVASVGFSPPGALEAIYGLGLIATVLAVYLFYRLGIAGVRSVGGGFSGGRLAQAFVHSLVPIALAYTAAHYVSFLLLQGQAIAPLASDPLGEGSDLFGTAHWRVDYNWFGGETFWYFQVSFVVAGHVAATG